MEMNYDEFLNWCEDRWTREYKMKRILSKLHKDDIDFLEEQLKANVIAILTDLQLDIEEKGMELCDSGWYLTYSDIIQQKIDALKEEDS